MLPLKVAVTLHCAFISTLKNKRNKVNNISPILKLTGLNCLKSQDIGLLPVKYSTKILVFIGFTLIFRHCFNSNRSFNEEY